MFKDLRGVAALVCLAGCAQSPLEVRETGYRTEALSTSAPLVAAHCIIREMESLTFGIGAKAMVSLRPSLEPNSYEIVIDVGGTLGYGLVSARDTGSKITIWRNSATPLIGASQVDGVAARC